MGEVINIPELAAGTWREGVAAEADLPASGNTLYDARISLSDESIYIWTGSAWVEIAGGGGGGGVSTVGAFSASAQTNGASISGSTITFGPASATVPGMLSTGAQTIAGVKTLSAAPVLSALTASTVPYLDAGKALASSAVTPTALGYIANLSSDAQTQITAKAPSASPTFSGTVTLPSGSVTSSAWDTGTSGLTVNGVTFASKAPSASPTFTGTVTMPSGSVTSSAWSTGSSTLTVNGVTFASRAPSASPTFTGVATFDDGSVSAPSITNAGDTNTGIYWPAGDAHQVGITTNGSANVVFETNGTATLTKAGSSTYAYHFGYSGSVQGVRFVNTNSTSSYLELLSGSKGWQIFTLDSTGFANKWRFQRVDNLYTGMWFGEQGQVYLGGNSVGQKGTTLTVQAQPNITNLGGTTTANASTTITGSGTSFLERLGIGDQIALSSATGTYADVTAIASATSATVSAALGDGTSQTINVKRAIQRWDKADGTTVGLVNTDGRWSIGETGSTSVTHKLTTAVGTPASDALTLGNGPSGKAGDPAVYIKINVNGTDRYIPAW